MKKIIMLISLILPIATNAATMCVQNNNVSILLDPAIEGTNYSYNTAQSTWWTWFPYGTIRGISACLSSNYGQSRGGYISQLTDQGSRVVGGETNGEHCWCKMTHPAASLWVFHNADGSGTDCANLCAIYCGYYARYYSDLRRGLFGSVRN